RLHAGIEYMRPKDYYSGSRYELHEERKRKLQNARDRRRAANLGRCVRSQTMRTMEGDHTKLSCEESLISC
ncbi:MAG: hypothetical protein NTZ78_01590, partial [Candidatus Aureabacteria bacterium]|nr:hypothetical protein [Candidatus Auribacterota bacterium]